MVAVCVGMHITAFGSSPRMGELYAQSRADLEAARKLFAQAMKDEHNNDYESAIAKYERVLAVKETAPVHFRLGACHEALRHHREAIAHYELAVSQADRSQADVATAAEERIEAVRAKFAMITIELKEPGPATVSVDGKAVASNDVSTPLTVEPGGHVVTAERPGMRPFRSEISLSAGAKATVTITFEKEAVQPASQTPMAAPSESQSKTIGWISLGVGGALLAGGGVVALMRAGNISDIEKACPDGNCPKARQGEIESKRDTAETQGPLAIILAGIGIAGVGLGTYLLLAPDKKPVHSSWVVNATAVSGGGVVRVAGEF